MLLAHKITVMERRLTNPSSGRISITSLQKCRKAATAVYSDNHFYSSYNARDYVKPVRFVEDAGFCLTTCLLARVSKFILYIYRR
jgi:hypothetical protein